MPKFKALDFMHPALVSQSLILKKAPDSCFIFNAGDIPPESLSKPRILLLFGGLFQPNLRAIYIGHCPCFG